MENIKGLRSICAISDLETFSMKHDSDHFGKRDIVVNDQDP
jgi:hypothetical protein